MRIINVPKCSRCKRVYEFCVKWWSGVAFYEVQITRVGWPIKHSNPMVLKPGIGFGSVGRGQVL